MKRKTKAALAVSLAAVMTCGVLAGCDLVTTDMQKDLMQVVAEVDITKSADFAEGEQYSSYKEAISSSEVLKRDLIASFISSGYSMMQSYNLSYETTFNTICTSLVNNQIYLQYAKVYFFENSNGLYTPEGYASAIEGIEDESDREAAGFAYFLTAEEIAKADYDLKMMFNNTLDSQEQSFIDAEDEETSTTTVRTLPTGVDTENEEYYDPDYNIYTGDPSVSLGSYEKLDGSTTTTRKKAYNSFLANLRMNELIAKGEDTTKIESLSYYKLERKNAYGNALVEKMNEAFEDEAIATITDTYLSEQYAATLDAQKRSFADSSQLETALDAVSDTAFVLTAPEGYGFVINILLPFSSKQSEMLSDAPYDYQDGKGNKYATRAQLLANLRATDQRGTWITGSEDYSYESSAAYTGTGTNAAERKYVFFENSLTGGEGKKYEALKNYYGSYSYNGVVTEDKNGDPVVDPTPIGIDEFIAEMNGYLNYAFGTNRASGTPNLGYSSTGSYYNADGTTNYERFVYYKGSVSFDSYNANNLFVAGSDENKALSVINELSFAYNTDTAGLNTYLGYMVNVGNTDYVDEFEYAAQQVVEAGAGTYWVVATDYGWHIIYCTLSYHGFDSPVFSFDASEADTEGTFSYLWKEAYKSSTATEYSDNMRSKIITAYTKECTTVYSGRYSDLTSLGS